MKPITHIASAGALALLLGTNISHAQPRLAHNGEVHPTKPAAASAPKANEADNHGAMNHGTMNHSAPATVTSGPRTLPPLPANLPAWLDSKLNNEIFYHRGPYNFAIYEIPTLARDMNGVAVGHSMAYEALVTGREDQLETKVFNQIDRVLKNPPKLMPAERVLSPTFTLALS